MTTCTNLLTKLDKKMRACDKIITESMKWIKGEQREDEMYK
jgi:hypothetical protein